MSAPLPNLNHPWYGKRGSARKAAVIPAVSRKKTVRDVLIDDEIRRTMALEDIREDYPPDDNYEHAPRNSGFVPMLEGSFYRRPMRYE